jgi:hypothetical protein
VIFNPERKDGLVAALMGSYRSRGLMIDLSKPHAVVGSFNDMPTGNASFSEFYVLVN